MKDKKKTETRRVEIYKFAHFMPKKTKPLNKSKSDTTQKEEKKSTKK